MRGSKPSSTKHSATSRNHRTVSSDERGRWLATPVADRVFAVFFEMIGVAYATVATLDGLLLIRHTCGPGAAELAATALGVGRATDG